MRFDKAESFDWLPDYQQIIACQEDQRMPEGMGVIQKEETLKKGAPGEEGRKGQMSSGEAQRDYAGQDSSCAVLPPEALAREEQSYWKDYEYITQLLPLAARESWAAADAVLDRYEFEDSAIYREYPDKVTMERIADMVYEVMRYYEDRPLIQGNDGSEITNPYHCQDKEREAASPLRDMIITMTAWNISYRRQRYYRRRKVFPLR